MKAFHLEPGMTTLGGVFYPTGYMVLMYPGAQDARSACTLLARSGFAEEEVSLLTPQDFEREIVGAIGDEDLLPSAGTEGETARRFAELARRGHHAVMVHAPSARLAAQVMEVLRDTPISYGQRYRHLVIEDLA